MKSAALLQEASQILNVEVTQHDKAPHIYLLNMKGISLRVVLAEDDIGMSIECPLREFEDSQLERTAEMLLAYNTQSFQSGGMRLVVGAQNILWIINDLHTESWEAERLAKFLLGFLEVAVGWMQISNQMVSLDKLAQEAPQSAPQEPSPMLTL